MLLFWSEEHIEKWCTDWNLPLGEHIDLNIACRLAFAWYGPDRRQPDWQRRTVDEAESLFAELGLTSPFWNLRGQ